MRRAGIFIIVVALVALWWARALVGPAERSLRTAVFEVEAGQDARTVARNLKEQGLIKNALAFETYVSLRKAQTNIKAGRYVLSPHDTLFTIADILITGNDRTAKRVTLIEGWSLAEYRAYLSRQGFDAKQFDALTKASAWADAYPFVKGLPKGATLEGYLFPDTYAVTSDRDARALIKKMLDTFALKVASLPDAPDDAGRTLRTVVILASIIEREAPESKDRRIISGIFRRRLERGIALQSDATINYLTGSGRSRATGKDLAIDSPYNTYKHAGLPPGPIGNPGLDALRAAASPQANDYLYFLTGTDGRVHYARTFEEHKQNRERFL